MPYPMRYVRSRRYKLIHNLNFWAPFPIDQDFYLSPTFQVCLGIVIIIVLGHILSNGLFMHIIVGMSTFAISYCSLQWILQNTAANKSVHWYKSLEGYYRRPEWELYDLKLDPEELHNAAEKTSYQVTISLA